MKVYAASVLFFLASLSLLESHLLDSHMIFPGHLYLHGKAFAHFSKLFYFQMHPHPILPLSFITSFLSSLGKCLPTLSFLPNAS